MGNRTLPSKNVTPATQQSPKSRKPIAKKRSGIRLLLHLAQRHPFLCLIAVWGSLVYFGWLAISGLTYIDPAPLEVSESPKMTESQPVAIDKPATSIGMLAIVAVSCAAGSVILARQLRPVKPEPRRAMKRVQPVTKVRASRPINSTPQPSQPVMRNAAPITAKPPARPSIVTILSVENEEPLENGDVTLAEIMDIRRQA